MTWLHDLIDSWRSGTRRSQLIVLAALVVGVCTSFAVSLDRYTVFPTAGYFVWLLLGRLLLRFAQLVVLTAVIVVTATVARFSGNAPVGGRYAAELALLICCALVMFAASRHRDSLPGPLSEALLADLRHRLAAQGRVPALPDDWSLQTAMVTAHGVGYAGDFMVADLDEPTLTLDLVLVDVVGKGVKAAPAALLFAGALGGLVGTLRGPALLGAANKFLLRQSSDETFATAVHLSVSLADGHYAVRSAGHPPALRWSHDDAAWTLDNARGLALGVLPHPELHVSEGVLGPGEALLFYTDGVVETPRTDIDDGISWLCATAGAAVLSGGFDGLAQRVVDQVARGDDDRAVLVISRRSTPEQPPPRPR